MEKEAVTSSQGVKLGGLHGGAIRVGPSLKDVEDLGCLGRARRSHPDRGKSWTWNTIVNPKDSSKLWGKGTGFWWADPSSAP